MSNGLGAARNRPVLKVKKNQFFSHVAHYYPSFVSPLDFLPLLDIQLRSAVEGEENGPIVGLQSTSGGLEPADILSKFESNLIF